MTAGSPDVLWLLALRALGHAECTRDYHSVTGQVHVRRPPLASLAGEPPAAPDGATAAQPGAGAPGAPAAPPPGAPAAAASPAPPRPRRVREDENTVVVRGTRYTKLECVGRGGSSKVFKVRRGSRELPAATAKCSRCGAARRRACARTRAFAWSGVQLPPMHGAHPVLYLSSALVSGCGARGRAAASCLRDMTLGHAAEAWKTATLR